MHHRRRRHDTDRSRSDISRAAAAAAAIAAAAAAPLSAAYAFDEEESMTLEDNIHARAREADRADLHGARPAALIEVVTKFEERRSSVI